MRTSVKLFLVLWLAGCCGVLSFQLVDFTALIALLPAEATKAAPPMSPVLLRMLAFLQPAVLLAVAVVVGLVLTPKIGLSAPVAEAIAQGRPLMPAWRPQILPGIVGGLVGAAAIVGSWAVAKPFLPLAFTARAEGFNHLLPIWTRLLYGGITEELLLRWGFMSFLVWALWKVGRKSAPGNMSFIAGIVIAAVMFGAGHLPIAVALAGGASVALVAYVLVANASFGIIAGYLFWKRGLEAAIIAHMVAHVVMVVLLSLAPSAVRA